MTIQQTARERMHDYTEALTAEAEQVVHEWERPWLYPKQRRAIFDPARYSIIEASTKSGKTVGCLVWILDQAMLRGGPGRSFWWIAPVYGQAKIAYRRMKAGLPEGMYTANETELFLTLPNGATIWFKSGEKPDNLYGEDVFAAVVDEASRLREESWWAVRSTVTATRGPVRIIGNVKGRKNWAYVLARKAELGAPNMAFHKIIAADAVQAKILAADEVADAKAVLPEAVYKELYEAEPNDDGGNPFGLAAIAGCIVEGLSLLPPVAFGVDLAKSNDYTVIVGLDKNGRVSVLVRFQKGWEETIPDIVRNVKRKWAWWQDQEGQIVEFPAEQNGDSFIPDGGAATDRIDRIEQAVRGPVLMDSTGVGDPIVERMQKLVPTRVEGFKFSSPSKQQLMEELQAAIHNREVEFPGADHPVGLILKNELEMFEYEYTRTGVRYTAPEGFHDDTVDAIALAVRAWRTRPGRPNVRFF